MQEIAPTGVISPFPVGGSAQSIATGPDGNLMVDAFQRHSSHELLEQYQVHIDAFLGPTLNIPAVRIGDNVRGISMPTFSSTIGCCAACGLGVH